MPHIPPKIDWKDSAVTGHPAKSSRFERDKFTGYLFAPFVDALTDDRRHIEMRGCRYTAPPLTSTGSVVYRTLRGYCNKFCKCTKGRRFHNHVGAFRRKADYTQIELTTPWPPVFCFFEQFKNQKKDCKIWEQLGRLKFQRLFPFRIF